MPKIGPFFYIDGKLIKNACSLEDGREQAGKLDNSYGHEKLYDDYFKTGDYIDFPRGRVIYDLKTHQSIIYIDPCIDNENVLSEIVKAFEVDKYITAFDLHYHCKNCSDAFLKEMFGD